MKYSEQVFYYSKQYELDYFLVLSIIKVESNFDKDAKSSKGAKGLMQIKESTASFVAKILKLENYDLQNEDDNINIGCYYVHYLIDKFNNVETAIVAYNAGEGNVYSWLNDINYSDDKTTLKIIPFSESKNYLEKIEKTFNRYKKLYCEFI